jgi:hypothetical protein
MKSWKKLMQTVAKRLAIHNPNDERWTVSWTYVTRRVDSIDGI